MSTIVIPAANWPRRLQQAIHEVKDGDTIQVASEEARDAARRALARIKPDALVFVEVKWR